MDHSPLVSIIIPTYDRSIWLKQAIESTLGQEPIPMFEPIKSSRLLPPIQHVGEQ